MTRSDICEEMQKVTSKIVQIETLSDGQCLHQLVIDLMCADRPELYRVRMPDYINNKHQIAQVVTDARKLVGKTPHLETIKLAKEKKSNTSKMPKGWDIQDILSKTAIQKERQRIKQMQASTAHTS